MHDWVSGVILHRLCDVTLWIQLKCSLTTLQQIFMGAHGARLLTRGGGGVAPWPPLRTATDYVYSITCFVQNRNQIWVYFTLVIIFPYFVRRLHLSYIINKVLNTFINSFLLGLFAQNLEKLKLKAKWWFITFYCKRPAFQQHNINTTSTEASEHLAGTIALETYASWQQPLGKFPRIVVSRNRSIGALGCKWRWLAANCSTVP